MKNFSKKLILASKSPRRKQLLLEAGFSFEVKTNDVPEVYPKNTKPRKIAEILAEQKAEAGKIFIQDDEIILAADTIVVKGNKIFGKPVDYNDAFNILKDISGKKHEVITGVCLISKNKKRIFSSVSKVYFEELSDREIDYYIENFKPFDKAGAYAIQEWIGLCKIKKIEGSYFNIMGLPVDIVYKELMKF